MEFARFQPRMVALVADVRKADLRSFRTLSSEVAWQQIVARASRPIVTRLTHQARALSTELAGVAASVVSRRGGATTPSLPPAFLSFEQTIDDAVRGLDAREGSVEAIEDISFLVGMELRQREERLTRLTDGSEAVTVIGECDSALRRIVKGFGALDVAISRAERIPPALEFASELRESLLVRRTYMRFIRYFEGTLEGASLEARMRCVAGRLDHLAEGDVAPLLRVRDRLQILSLQARVRTWLSTAEPVDGDRLWQDLVGFVEMLSLVNRRQELVEHDGRALRELLAQRDDVAISTDPTLAQLLRSLEGLDEGLDGALSRPSTVGAVRPALLRVAARLGVGRAS